MPVREIRPCVAATPTRLFKVVGLVMEPVVSLPRPIVANHAAMAAPVPELEPPPLFTGLYRLTTRAFSVPPPCSPTPYQSDWLSLPKIIAPCARRRAMTNESRDGWEVAIG